MYRPAQGLVACCFSIHSLQRRSVPHILIVLIGSSSIFQYVFMSVHQFSAGGYQVYELVYAQIPINHVFMLNLLWRPTN